LKFSTVKVGFQPRYWEKTDQPWISDEIKDTFPWKIGM